MKGLLFILSIFGFHAVYSQTLVHNGGIIVAKQGAQIIVKGDYLCKASSEFKTQGISYLKIHGDWINNSTNPYFQDNHTRIEFDKSAVEIKGNRSTHFPWLNLSGKGIVRLFTDITVGGYYKMGIMGQLRINDSKLLLQGRKLILNNPQSNSVSWTSGGGIVSETNSSLGYGSIQWNVRKGNGGPVFQIPLLNEFYEDISAQFFINGEGTETADSGYITLATYPTADVVAPNNRPLPLGVFHTDNECEGENSIRIANRFWIIEEGNYSMAPDITLNLRYAERDIQGVNDQITEVHLGGIQWNAILQKWQYPLRGNIDATNNWFRYRARRNFSGIWALSDTTPYPRAQFSVQGNCEKDQITFSDLSLEGKDKIVNQQWLFGDGEMANGKTVIHYYLGHGLFDCKLIIRSQSGCFDTAEQRILVHAAPTADFELMDTCENTWVRGKSKSYPGSGFIDRLEWSFGMGEPPQTSTEASYYYGSVGLPEIQLIVYNSKGCKDTMLQKPFIAPKPFANAQYEPVCQRNTAVFTNSSIASGGTLISHYWDFGNGSRSGQPNEKILYPEYGTFPIIYAVENSFGCKDTFKGEIDIYPRAVAKFDYLPIEPEMMKEINLRDLSIHTGLWEWNFGDGFFSTVQNPKHIYANHGNYEIQLIANNLNNCPDSLTKKIRVKSTPLYWIPEAFTPGTTEGRNDSFGVFTPLKIHHFNMSIYNRWGQEIFQSKDPYLHWDGTVNGELAMPGNYIYHIHFQSPENDIMTYKGSVLLLR